MIHVRSFRTAGKCHGFDISRCQDQIRILSDATQTTIVLCDGAGSSPYGGIAASVTASILARNLHSNFEQYLHNALPDIKMQLTRTINNELKKMAKEMQIAPRLLATTILAISMDKTWCQKDHSFIRWNEQPERSSHFRYLFCAESGSPESENDKHQKF